MNETVETVRVVADVPGGFKVINKSDLRIGKFAEAAASGEVDIHIYDHHPDSPDDLHGSLEMVEPLGSTTAILTRLIRERGLGLTPPEATIMALGIFEDTGSFIFTSTTPEDFEAMPYLLGRGADLNVVAQWANDAVGGESAAVGGEPSGGEAGSLANGRASGASAGAPAASSASLSKLRKPPPFTKPDRPLTGRRDRPFGGADRSVSFGLADDACGCAGGGSESRPAVCPWFSRKFQC